MNKKITTIEDLAAMIQRTMASKEEIQEFRRDLADEHERIRSEIQDIKTTLGPLVRIVAAMEREFQDLHIRISRLERKVGLAKP
jgi:predicted  nucleic acid-binding Zn-ribbon protein